MTNSSILPRRFIVLAMVLPLAAIIGYLIATPQDFDSVVLICLVIFGLLLPVLLKHHHAILILVWNALLSLYFLPGSPNLWVIFSLLSFGIAVLERGLAKKEVFTFIPSLVWPLLMLSLVVIITLKLRGGMGVRSMGSASYGGKGYFFLLVAVLGYFALTSQRIEASKARFLIGGFFAAGTTAAMGNIIYMLGPLFYGLFNFFPVDFAVMQVMGESSVIGSVSRIAGFAFGAPSLIYVMLLLYGMRGIFTIAHPLRFIIFLFLVGFTFLGGFRSSLINLGLLFFILFFLEKLHRTRMVLYASVALVISACLLIPFAKFLPSSIQRTLSVLPLAIDPIAKYDAQLSTEWRIEMWKIVLPEVPKYLLLGKGCAVDGTEMYLMHEAVRQGFYKNNEEAILVGGYHNGPLTLLVQFGVFGAFAFLWFCVSTLKLLYRYYQNCEPALKQINTFLLAYLITKLIYFFLVYGHFTEDFYMFVAVAGLAVSLNGKLTRTANISTVAVAKPKGFAQTIGKPQLA